jgi:hypothetical protein
LRESDSFDAAWFNLISSRLKLPKPRALQLEVNPQLRTRSKRAASGAAFLTFGAYRWRHKNKKRGGAMNNLNNMNPDQRGFCIQDILWAVGIWSVILSLSPVVLFYVLMVN